MRHHRHHRHHEFSCIALYNIIGLGGGNVHRNNYKFIGIVVGIGIPLFVLSCCRPRQRLTCETRHDPYVTRMAKSMQLNVLDVSVRTPNEKSRHTFVVYYKK